MSNSVSYRQGASVEFEGPSFVTTSGGGGVENPASEFNLSSVSSYDGSTSTAPPSAEPAKRDFSNPVFDAMRSMENAAAAAAVTASVPEEEPHRPTPFDEADIRAGFVEPPSAIVNPSSSASSAPDSPSLDGGPPPLPPPAAPSKKKDAPGPPKELAPSKVDTGKDTQCLVEEGDEEEEDFSEC